MPEKYLLIQFLCNFVLWLKSIGNRCHRNKWTQLCYMLYTTCTGERMRESNLKSATLKVLLRCWSCLPFWHAPAGPEQRAFWGCVGSVTLWPENHGIQNFFFLNNHSNVQGIVLFELSLFWGFCLHTTVSSSPFRSCLACSRLSICRLSSASLADFSDSSSFSLS